MYGNVIFSFERYLKQKKKEKEDIKALRYYSTYNYIYYPEQFFAITLAWIRFPGLISLSLWKNMS